MSKRKHRTSKPTRIVWVAPVVTIAATDLTRLSEILTSALAIAD